MTDVLRLLAVDDDRMVLDLLQRGLSREGIEVDVASSPADAARILARSTPDFVLVDANIPGMSSADLAHLVATHAGARFVLFSADDPGKLRRLSASVGAHAWLSKSSPLAELAQQIRQLHARPHP